MIQVTRLNRTTVVLNSDLIELVEVNRDTVIVMTSGQKFVVLETADEVVQRVIGFRRMIYTNQVLTSAYPVNYEHQGNGSNPGS